MNGYSVAGVAVLTGVLAPLAMPAIIAGAILAVCCAACGRPSC